MEFSIIKMKKQAITKDIVEEALRICYDNISFSTFPYIVYGLNSSKKTLQQYNSGNCIALSLFLKTYFKNLGIISHLIPASVPKIHMVPGVNHICHVSLLIPYDKDKYFIVDPAFHFLEPLNCIEKENENVEPASNSEGRKKKEKLNVKSLVSSASNVYNKQQVPKHLIDNYYNKKSLRTNATSICR